MTDLVDPSKLDHLTLVVAENLIRLRRRIAQACGEPRAVTIIAVTKGFGPEAALAALNNGLTMLGENYAAELVEKAAVVAAVLPAGASGPEWHFQGRLQTNKINKLRPIVRVWQSVDSIDRVDALAKRVPGASVCVQVRLTDDSERAGALPVDVPTIVERARSNGLDVLGLMGVGPDPANASGDASRESFACVNRLCVENHLAWRSMGMSGDLEIAVEQGATHVRIGTALFGER